jgi:virginiamycin B lyase
MLRAGFPIAQPFARFRRLRVNVRLCFRFALGALVTALAACSGGGSSTPVSSSSATPSPHVSPSATVTPMTSSQQFVFTIPLAKTASVRNRSDLPAGAQSITFVVTGPNGTALPPYTVAIGAGAPGCVSSATVITCTENVPAFAGVDTFVISVFDTANGTGTAVATSTLTETVGSAGATPIPIVFGGVIASITIAPANAYPPAGTPTSIPLVVTAKDAAGNTIAGSYASPITLSSSGGGTSITPASVTSSSQAVVLAYDGTATSAFSVSASGPATATASIVPTTAAVLVPLPEPSAVPFRMVRGPDGAYYFVDGGPTDSNGAPEVNARIGRFDPATNLTSIVTLASGRTPNDLVFTPDGALWVATARGASEDNTTPGELARISPFAQSGLTEIPIAASIPEAAGDTTLAYVASSRLRTLAVGNDGLLYAADRGKEALLRQPIAGPYDGSAITQIPVYNAGFLNALALGPDGNFYVQDSNDETLTAINPTTFAIQRFVYSNNRDLYPRYLAFGSDGNAYATSLSNTLTNYGFLDRFTTSGADTEIALPSPDVQPDSIITATPNLSYFSDIGAGGIGSVTTSGAVQIWPIVGIGAFSYALPVPEGLATAPDGSLYYTTINGQIGHLIFAQGWTVFPTGALSVNGTGAINEVLIGIAESGESGPFTVTSANTAIATVTSPPGNGTPGAATFPHNFVVIGNAPGATTIAVSDAHGRTQTIPVAVTATNATINARGRHTPGRINAGGFAQ